jgi:methylated-DNA-[protein]-cysteine S-methyltransferase
MTSYSILKTTQGDVMLVANTSELIGLYFVGGKHVPQARSNWKLDPEHPVLREAAKQLGDYFEGKRTDFSLPLHFAGTDFQNRVWQEIARIPHGKTISYSELARRAGKPQAVRATGTSTGRNPLSIVIPCHRVMGKNGSMTGFGGGLEWKRYLHGIENIEPSK